MRKPIPVEHPPLKDLASLLAGAIVRIHAVNLKNNRKKARIVGSRLAIDAIPAQYKHSPRGGEANNGTTGKKEKKTGTGTVCP